ncbi:D-alanyl-D-alanine carboxypeptidase family protein [Acutalibacter sp. 1XD8-33]|uniref:M15 family metallopeptidase n=1 Tax=Acutalibacter sp. 1XD8-33 TaxID=2320081 RepID=UPI000EA337A1|nr:M15 family metallopeptidase [Acutalibacter sp. 1XD8-33]RKJ38635.1 D-alanyl-D-alanine carboxypeptidase family protein [Acutalibacter sp. 1XD8-33]
MTAREAETRRSRRTERKNREGAAAAMVIMAVLMCMAIVVFAIWSAGKASESNAVEAGGKPVTLGVARTPSTATGAAAENPNSQSSYQQLSDPFLVLVNTQVPLPENWQVTPAFIGEETVDNRIYDDLNAMFLAAQADGITLWVASGYRSVEDQERILSREIRQHMQNDGMTEEEAREFSLRTINPPGHSEHHTGFVVDLNDVSDNFEETEAYQWLSEHAAEYGFVQRYRSDKVEFTGIDNESWHYRYIGKNHAQEMESLDMCLEEYVEYLKGQGVQ